MWECASCKNSNYNDERASCFFCNANRYPTDELSSKKPASHNAQTQQIPQPQSMGQDRNSNALYWEIRNEVKKLNRRMVVVYIVAIINLICIGIYIASLLIVFAFSCTHQLTIS